ncbi:TPA: transcription termination/antitermination factor NusG [Candidatus Campbellbacteria bacterium]|jgi:transcriptional antiterminator NusG|uniref:Transcription termination/antitermination protein NusG n=1 Tax=Candidatus Campbellbacteria bacterium RIFCSPLOWO2_01_FULL_34_15 TaxID=1797579 RepID=A0A1F5EPS5_9BACT|nr:MAG: transcription antitermination protein transcriptional antiterminator NusG [Candidatus Campbellbacteria bacterium GW2011_OD1_34_28]KKP75212.1 MAG: Transcription antitermination protein nusG [Candidatus Campbellbacteria bacterium GW2011_GWD2_35_24]KKP76227.1 MAG: transcription antitermination protein transcriptional antiterminator NusG [Candidatus Campbellbacteria bacterium GW2011_GWC2_35_28]KKP77416.1 MAG: Transcription antitermination protein nusG [Candidatus Campbellbacteria bacterium G
METQENEQENKITKQDASAGRNWYAIHTYAGYENAVVRNLKQRVESLGMQDLIFDVVVPTEKKIKIKGGKRVEEMEKVYPGYVLVDMIVTDESWYVVRNTPRVTGFVGAGVNPVPVSQTEMVDLMARMNTDITKHSIDLQADDAVIIVDGPFKDTEGKVIESDEKSGKVKVLVSMFGRETPVELDFLQVKRI